MNTLDGLLHGITTDPQDEGRWLILADWLDDHDDPRRAELLRLHRQLLATCCEPNQHPERARQQTRIVELLGQGVKPCVPHETVSISEGVEMTFNFIPPGTFLMGSPVSEAKRDDNEIQHRVTITKGYWLGIHPVTQVQWQAVLGTNPGKFQGDTLPVENVSWDDCVAFCERLVKKTGQSRFCLPTEAEWESACRAGTTTPFFFGKTISTDQANYHGSFSYGKGKKGVYRRKTMPVGSFPANAWGLFELHGNVREWCQDCYGDYPKEDQTDPVRGNSGDARVLRGGSWGNAPIRCRSACRFRFGPGDRNGYVGCRVLLCLD